MNPRNSLNPAIARMSAIGPKTKQVREAKQMEKIVHDRARKIGEPAPPFELLEIIGKGSFGRVFKGSVR